jgi:catechol 2,3-dioxygenase-like lactoylglutathione lyase family enzyme
MVLTSSVVSHIWFLVEDLDRAVRFFGDVLGLRLLESRKGAARFDAGNLTIGLFQVEEAPSRSPIVTFRMEKGIEKFHDYLLRQGVKSKSVDLDFIGKVLSVEDPDGNLLWVHQPKEE